MDNHPQHSPDPGDARSEVIAARLAVRRRRVRAIRARVAGLSVVALMATSGVVVVQMLAGHDPALAQTQTTSRVSTVADRTTRRTTTRPAATTTAAASSTTHKTDARTTAAKTASTGRTRATHHRASSAAASAASTPSTVTTSAS